MGQNKVNDVVDVAEQSDRSDSLNVGDTQRRRAIQECFAEGSNSQHKANGAAKPTNQKMKSENEVDQMMKFRPLEKIKVHPSSKFCQKLKMEQNKANDVVDVSEQSDRSDSFDMGDTQGRRATQECLTEGSNSQRKANRAAKPTSRKMKSRALEKIKVNPSSKFCQKLKNGTG